MFNLGENIQTFGTNKTTFYILIGVAVVCSMFALFSLWLAIDDYNAPPGVLDEMGFGKSARKNGLITGGIIGALNLLVAGGCIAAAKYQNSVKADLYADGIVSHRGKRIQQANWTDVTRVVEHRVETIIHGSANRRRSIRYYVNVHTSEDTILLRGIENIRRAGEVIARRCGLPLDQVND